LANFAIQSNVVNQVFKLNLYQRFRWIVVAVLVSRANTCFDESFEMKACGHLAIYLATMTFFALVQNSLGQTNIEFVGHIANGGTANGVVVSGGYAYLANGQDGLRIYDVSNPAVPTNIGHTNLTGDNFTAIVVRSSYAYLTGNPGLAIFDISDATKPTLISKSYLEIPGLGLCIAGDYAYVAGGYTGIHACDVSSPGNPVPMGDLVVNLSAYAVSVNGTHAYVAAKDGGIRVVDISDPGKLSEVASIRTASGYYLNIVVEDHYAYAANNSQGLLTYDIKDFKHATDLSPAPSSGATTLALAGNYAYVGRGRLGLSIYDISAPGTFQTGYPVAEIKTNYSGGVVNGLAISENYLYVANGGDGLRIAFLGTPAQPKLSLETTTNGVIQCAWPAPSAAFSIQESADINGTNWVTRQTGFTTEQSKNRVSVSPSSDKTFYRLISR
jgi:hypothetical protein